MGPGGKILTGSLGKPSRQIWICFWSAGLFWRSMLPYRNIKYELSLGSMRGFIHVRRPWLGEFTIAHLWRKKTGRFRSQPWTAHAKSIPWSNCTMLPCLSWGVSHFTSSKTHHAMWRGSNILNNDPHFAVKIQWETYPILQFNFFHVPQTNLVALASLAP